MAKYGRMTKRETDWQEVIGVAGETATHYDNEEVKQWLARS